MNHARQHNYLSCSLQANWPLVWGCRRSFGSSESLKLLFLRDRPFDPKAFLDVLQFLVSEAGRAPHHSFLAPYSSFWHRISVLADLRSLDR
jgi:hypothetical protein